MAIPYITNVGLSDLAHALDETAEWSGPLRGLILRSMLADDLRWERWESIRAMESDIRDACRLLTDRLRSLIEGRRDDSWQLGLAGATLSAGEHGDTPPEVDAVTDVLRAVSPAPSHAAPWVPYWLLTELGGRLEWTCPLDNRSLPKDDEPDDDVQSWLYPGTGGWGIALMRKFDA